MTSMTHESDANGLLPDLHVVGIHGRFGEGQTPARGAPVLADTDGHQVAVRAADPLGGRRFRVLVERARTKLDEDVWATTGTPIQPPWPARLGYIFAVLSDSEIRRASELLSLARASGDAPELRGFCEWLTTATPRSDRLAAARVDRIATWYCSPEHARQLWTKIASVAKQDIVDAVDRDDLVALEHASLWLSRAATDDAQIYLAVAGAREAGYRHWKALLDAGVRDGSETTRLANVDRAARQLHAPRSAQLPVPPTARFARAAVLDAAACLHAVRPRDQDAA